MFSTKCAYYDNGVKNRFRVHWSSIIALSIRVRFLNVKHCGVLVRNVRISENHVAYIHIFHNRLSACNIACFCTNFFGWNIYTLTYTCARSLTEYYVFPSQLTSPFMQITLRYLLVNALKFSTLNKLDRDKTGVPILVNRKQYLESSNY